MFHVKARLPGEKRFVFLSPRGETRLRIHASLYPTKERAEEEAAGVRKLNPGAEAIVVPAFKEKKSKEREYGVRGGGATGRSDSDRNATAESDRRLKGQDVLAGGGAGTARGADRGKGCGVEGGGCLGC